jgi:hypothetical protein
MSEELDLAVPAASLARSGPRQSEAMGAGRLMPLLGIVTVTRLGAGAETDKIGGMKPPLDPRYRHRFPAEIICHAVWLHHVFSLSLRDVELLLAERGIVVSYETVRRWS